MDGRVGKNSMLTWNNDLRAGDRAALAELHNVRRLRALARLSTVPIV